MGTLAAIMDGLGQLADPEVMWHEPSDRYGTLPRHEPGLWCAGSSIVVDPLNSFLFQPVLHNWCMCYPVWDDEYKRSRAASGKE